MLLNRREFLGSVSAATVLPFLQPTAMQTSEWGLPVLDLHFHMRGRAEANLAHLDGAGIRRAYALAADLGVPVLLHFQEVDHFENEGKWSSGFAVAFESILKTFPKTTFIGHADAFWANVSADYHNETAYPAGPVLRRGITDRLLSDYPNLYGDLSANSGNNMLSRDAEFTGDFLRRHQDKLLFGSDCGCVDGHGAGRSQGNNPAASRLAGKCVARETLTVLKRAASPEVFRKIARDNAHQLLKIPA